MNVKQTVFLHHHKLKNLKHATDRKYTAILAHLALCAKVSFCGTGLSVVRRRPCVRPVSTICLNRTAQTFDICYEAL